VENLIWALILCSLALILIPLERIKQIWPVAAVTFAWFFTVNYFFIGWGYYRFTHVLISVAGVPFIQALGGAGGGLLLMNWMPREPLYKIFLVVLASGFFSLSSYIFTLFRAFQYGHGFNHLLSFIHNLAMISILVWLCLAVTGPEKIYGGVNKTRFKKAMRTGI